MNKSKIVVLFIVIAIPLITYWFLRFFGENTFSLPIFYQDGVPQVSCLEDSKSPYVVHDTLKVLLVARDGSFLVSRELSQRARGTVNHILNQFQSKRIQWIELDYIKYSDKSLLSCLFFLDKSDNLVLIDSLQQIRGYYNINGDQEELDRLSVELDILLSPIK